MIILKTKINFLLLILLITLGCNRNTIGNKTSGKRPNIILMVADDLGHGDLGVNGNKLIETPNLDKLAASGINYRFGYSAAPLCSPSRASIVTGLSPARLHMTEHIHGHHPTPKNQKYITPKTAQSLDTSYTTLPEVLKKQGYTSAHIGKWHLGGGAYSPEFNGYDYTFAGSWAGLPNSFFYPFFNGNSYPELKASSKEGDYLTDVLTGNAIQWMTKYKSNPFFLALNFYAPHVPIEGKTNLVDYYTQKGTKLGIKLPNAHYAAMVHAIDDNVGRIVDFIKKNQLEENTIIIFTSDNGALHVEEVPAFAKHTPPTTNTPLAGGKGYMNEGGIRVPFICSYKSVIKPNSKSDEPVVGTDLMNTLAKLAGSSYKTSDGRDISPTWKGRTLGRNIYWHFPHYSPQRGIPAAAIINGKYKLYVDYEKNTTALYNFHEDESESKDLSEKFSALKTKMYKSFIQWKEESKAQELVINKD